MVDIECLFCFCELLVYTVNFKLILNMFIDWDGVFNLLFGLVRVGWGLEWVCGKEKCLGFTGDEGGVGGRDKVVSNKMA